uniref:Map3k7 C-terminal like n=2 Tax=Sinocyclocheilus TaxID=75365 RepID=A0A671RCF7_9TELE
IFIKRCDVLNDYNMLFVFVTLRRELMAELLEDEKVSMEFARLEEEYSILTEENQNLITVHSQRAQQLETLRVISQKRQGSS